MCLITFSYRTHPAFPLIIAANRDEFLDRETAPAEFWDDRPDILAGRDLRAGGTWMGVSSTGRFSALTNYRDPSAEKSDAPSRGSLVSAFLSDRASSTAFLESLQPVSDSYNGFNLLTYDGQELGYMSNAHDENPVILPPGIYGLSNHFLDSPWPKVQLAKKALRAVTSGMGSEPESDAGQGEKRSMYFETDSLFSFLRDDAIAADDQLPSTGVPLHIERALSAAFIRMPGYGTRCSTLVLFGIDGDIQLLERTYDPAGEIALSRSFNISQTV